jgi:hypothetical protein
MKSNAPAFIALTEVSMVPNPVIMMGMIFASGKTLDDFESIAVGKLKVRDNDVNRGLLRHLNGTRPIASQRHGVPFLRERFLEDLQYGWIVINDEDVRLAHRSCLRTLKNGRVP